MLAMRFVDGLGDVVDYNQTYKRYDVRDDNGTPTTGGQGALGPGRFPRTATAADAGAYSWQIFNTGFGGVNFITPDDMGGAGDDGWIVHVNFYTPSLPFSGGLLLLRFDGSSPSTHAVGLAFLAPDQLEIWIGGDGKNVLAPRAGQPIARYPLGGSFGANQWLNLQIKVVTGAHGGVKVLVNRSVALDVQNIPIDPVTRITRRWEALSAPQFAPYYDDLVIWSSDDGSDDFPGEVVVDSVLMGSDVSFNWQHGSQGTFGDPWNGHNYSVINDHRPITAGQSPDQDEGYVDSWGVAGGIRGLIAETYRTRPLTCFGQVQGVALNVCARKVSGGLDGIVALCDGNPIGDPIALITPPTIGTYAIRGRILELSPATGQKLTDREIAALIWGVNLPPATIARLTALFIEKVVDLTGKPFNCGGGSYAF